MRNSLPIYFLKSTIADFTRSHFTHYLPGKRWIMAIGSYGLPPQLCIWIKSYLSTPTPNFTIHGHWSDLQPIKAGVSQGPVLASTIFFFELLITFCRFSKYILLYTGFDLTWMKVNKSIFNKFATLYLVGNI